MSHTPFPSRQIHLNSQDGHTMSATDEATKIFYFNTPIINVPNSYDLIVSCVSASIPYSWYNIDDTSNFLLINGLSIVIPIGQYSITTLLFALNKLLSTVDVAATYDYATHLVTLTSSTDIVIDSTSNLSNVLGIYALTGNPIVGTRGIDMVKTNSVFIETPELINEGYITTQHGGVSSGVLCRIPVNGLPNNLISWTNVFGTKCKIHLKQINQIVIRLLDDNKRPLKLNGYVWDVSLNIDVVEAAQFIPGTFLEPTFLPAEG